MDLRDVNKYSGTVCGDDWLFILFLTLVTSIFLYCTDNIMKKLGVRHVQILLLFLIEAIGAAMRAFMSVTIVAMTDTTSDVGFPVFDWNSQQRSLIQSSILWGTFVGQIPIGLSLMRFNTHKLYSTFIFIASLTFFPIPWLAVNYGWTAVLGAMTIIGTMLGCLEPCTHALLSRWTPDSERSRLGSFVLNGGNVGITLITSISGLLAGSKSLGWPSIFYGLGIVGMSWAILFYFVGANSPSQHPRISPEEAQYIENNTGITKESLKFPWKSIVKAAPVWALLICICCHLWNVFVVTTQMPTFIKYILNFDITKSGLVSSLPYLSRIIMTLVFGWLADYALRRGAPVTMIRKILVTVGMMGPALTFIGLCFIDPENSTTVVLILVTIVALSSAVVSGLIINVLDLCPNFAGTVYSIMNTTGKVFGILAPIACGAIVTDTRDLTQWHIVFYISAGVYLFSNLVFVTFGSAEKQAWNEPNYINEPTIRLSATTVKISR